MVSSHARRRVIVVEPSLGISQYATTKAAGTDPRPFDGPMRSGSQMSGLEQSGIYGASGRPGHYRDAGIPEELVSKRELIHDAPSRVASSLAKGGRPVR